MGSFDSDWFKTITRNIVTETHHKKKLAVKEKIPNCLNLKISKTINVTEKSRIKLGLFLCAHHGLKLVDERPL